MFGEAVGHGEGVGWGSFSSLAWKGQRCIARRRLEKVGLRFGATYYAVQVVDRVAKVVASESIDV